MFDFGCDDTFEMFLAILLNEMFLGLGSAMTLTKELLLKGKAQVQLTLY
jgi:hypothetical protein